MAKRLHTNTKIFFKNPYVVRIILQNMQEFQQIKKYARENIFGTWGYSELKYDYVDSIIQSVYFCFADTQDALQFSMYCSKNIKKVIIWPELTFTITEYIQTEQNVSE